MIREVVPPGQRGEAMDDCHSAEVKEDRWDNSGFLRHVHEQAKASRQLFTDLGADDEPH